jgi:hypothetical protein
MGYTPVFDSVFRGSLYGKWPDTAAWLCLLALADYRGYVDATPEAISGMTGMPLSDLLGCIERFMQPDPRSRSQAEEGRKLVLIDAARNWGWRVVNIQAYRKKASGQDQIDDGRNAIKVKRYKERHRKTPLDTAGHPEKASDTNSYSDSNKDSDKEGSTKSLSQGGTGGMPRAQRSAEPRGSRIPDPFLVTSEMRTWASERTPHVDLNLATEEFCNYWRSKPGKDGRKLDWVLTWKNRMLECEGRAARPQGVGKKSFDERMAALREDGS